MKKLHKKIGAMALASMIVLGGVGASKIDSHALWWRRPSVVIDHNNWDLKKLSKDAFIDFDYLDSEFLKIHDVRVVAISENKDDMDNYIKSKYAKNPELKNRLLRPAPYSFYGLQFMDMFNGEVKRGNNIVKMKFGSVYLIVSKY